jgi:hypothetical protein
MRRTGMKRFAAALLLVLGGAGLVEAGRLPKPISLVQREPKAVHTRPYVRGNRLTDSRWGIRGSALETMRPFHLNHGVRGN